MGLFIASIYFFITRHTHGHLIWGISLLIITVFISIYALRKKHEYDNDVRQQNAEGEVDYHIETALKKMRALGVYYTLEDNANQQLSLMLRELMPGVDIQLMKPGSTEGDIRVANTLIEGKLDLRDSGEMHRLEGQLQEYCRNTPYRIRVVVYGRMRSDFRRRIENLPQYYDRILLHHIDGIKTRKPAGKRFRIIQQTDGDEYDS